MASAGVKRQHIRIAWVLSLAVTLAVLAVFAPRAFAATFAYTLSGNPHTGTVVCYANTQTCDIYPESSIGTSGWAPRDFNDANWSFPPYSQGGVVYINTSGGWIASATATTVDQQQAARIHLGPISYAKSMCRNATAYTATNLFQCVTTNTS